VFEHLIKLALSEEKRDALLSKVDNARPWVGKSLAGAGGGLWAGQMLDKLRTAPQGKPRKGLPLGLALVGMSMGVGQEKLRRMAQQGHYRGILKETRKQEA
jgi:hypothetical protein